MFYFSLIFLFVAMILNFPFPHKYPYGEAIFMILNIPIRFANGVPTVVITTLLLLMVGLYLLEKSLQKYRMRIVIIAVFIAVFAPVFAVNSFQKNFATGIYAVSYSEEESNCSFEMINEKTLQAECELPFKNYSNNDVQFSVEFYEELVFKDYPPMVSLMNNNAPYEIMLKGKENKHVKIRTNIDVSNMENHIESGEATSVNIIIKSKGKSRNL